MWFLIWLFLGGFIGWLYWFVTRAHPRIENQMSILAGIVGALVGSLVALALGYEPFEVFSLEACLISSATATVFVLICNIFKIDWKNIKKV